VNVAFWPYIKVCSIDSMAKLVCLRYTHLILYLAKEDGLYLKLANANPLTFSLWTRHFKRSARAADFLHVLPWFLPYRSVLLFAISIFLH
jgi:hypothetical protein